MGPWRRCCQAHEAQGQKGQHDLAHRIAKLVDVRQKDGSTVKKLKVWLTDFGYLPGQTSRAKPECDQNGSDQAETVPAPAEVMDGDREPLPG